MIGEPLHILGEKVTLPIFPPFTPLDTQKSLDRTVEAFSCDPGFVRAPYYRTLLSKSKSETISWMAKKLD